MSDGPETELETYIGDIETTVEAAKQAGHPEHAIAEELDTLVAGLGGDHRIEDSQSLREELDALVRNAYLPGDEVAAVLAAKVEELESIGENAPEFDELVQEDVESTGATHGEMSVVDTEKADVDAEELKNADADTLEELGIDVDTTEEEKSAQREAMEEWGIDPDELEDDATDETDETDETNYE